MQQWPDWASDNSVNFCYWYASTQSATEILARLNIIVNHLSWSTKVIARMLRYLSLL